MKKPSLVNMFVADHRKLCIGIPPLAKGPKGRSCPLAVCEKLSDQKNIACSAGVFFERAIYSRKRHVVTSRREEEMWRVKGSGEGAGREKRKRLPENTVKMRNTP